MAWLCRVRSGKSESEHNSLLVRRDVHRSVVEIRLKSAEMSNRLDRMGVPPPVRAARPR